MGRIPEGLATSNSGSYPPHRPVSVQESRALDRAAIEEFFVPSIVLMEHASRGVAEVTTWLCDPGAPVLVLCGPGNNGGDGYGAARFLHSWGHEVMLVRLAPHPPAPQTDAGQEARLAARDGLTLHDGASDPGLLNRALDRRPAVVVDAIFGSGLARPMEAPWVDWIETVNAYAGLRLAVDVPSGMNADTGEPLPTCIRADVTASMAAPKVGFAAAPDWVGHVVEVDIGLPAALHGPFLAAQTPTT